MIDTSATLWRNLFLIPFVAGISCSSGGAGSVSLTKSTITVSPRSGIAANGEAEATITVTLLDDDGDPVKGVEVAFAATGKQNTLVQPDEPTNDNGVATGTIASRNEETKSVTAVITPGEDDEKTLSQSVTVTFGAIFGASINTGVGGSPRAAVVGDFNGDGASDLAVPNFDSNSVSALYSVTLGQGVVALARLDFSSGGEDPSDVAVDDFDGDGNADLAVVNTADNNVAILLGKGNGTFDDEGEDMAGPPLFDTGAAPVGIVSGDFNGDGQIDLATADSGAGFSILIGNGDGTFDDRINGNAGTAPSDIVAADFNGNGNLDLAISNSTDNNVSVLLGQGDGDFSSGNEFDVGEAPRGIHAADLDGDGDVDIVTANDTGNSVSILNGNGSGSFGDQVELDDLGAAARGVTVGDINGDAIADLLIAAGDDLLIRLGDGLGTFGSQSNFDAQSNARAVAVGDLNGDQLNDAAVVNQDSGSVSVFTIPQAEE